jgi:hypothetical protein
MFSRFRFLKFAPRQICSTKVKVRPAGKFFATTGGAMGFTDNPRHPNFITRKIGLLLMKTPLERLG